MSDWSGKHRPILERIACLSGKSVGVSVMSSGGMPSITDQDIAGAVAMARQYKPKEGKKDGRPLETCARPELLLLKWGERADMAAQVAKKCADALLQNRRAHPERDERERTRITRAASLLAAQMIAGRAMDVELSAWALVCSVAEMQREIGCALAWMQGELAEAERSYCGAMRRWGDGAKAA